MNAVLTEPELVGLPLWGLVWFGMDFQESVFPDLGSLTSFFAKELKRTVHFVVFLHCFSGCQAVFFPRSFGVAIGVPLRRDLRFYIGLFICFLICSRQWYGGPRAGKVAMVTRFPFLQAGHLRCIKGAVAASFGLPRSSCSSRIIVLL